MMRTIPSDSESHERDVFGLTTGYRCPPADMLLPAIEGTLPEPPRARTLTHLDRCRVCRDLATVLESPEIANCGESEAARIRARIDRRVSSRRWAAGLATAAGIIITAGAMWIYQMPPVTVPDVAMRPAAPTMPKGLRTFVLALTVPPIELPPSALVLRGDTADSYATALAGALDPFRQGDYEEAARRLNAVRATRPDDPFASYYLGVSYLLAGRPSDASAPLEHARTFAGRDTALHREATWYLAIALERSDRVDQAMPLLTELCGDGGSRETQACTAVVALNPPGSSF